MQAIGDWFRRQNRRQERAVFLEDALLSDRYWAYGWHRLRFFLLRYVGDAVLHAIAVLLLYRLFPQSEFAELIMIQAAAGLIGSVWWGGLEVMRGRVRDLHRMGRLHLVAPEIGAWLSFALGIAGVIAVVTSGWLIWRVGVKGAAFGAKELYVVVVLLGLAITVITRALHSGVYAIRRVYRPLAAIVAVQLATFAALPVLWPWLGIWSFPLAVLFSTLIGAGITVRYTLRVYSFFGMEPASLLEACSPRIPRRMPWREFASAGLSFGLVKLDAFLVLALIGSRAAGIADSKLFALLFAMGPTIQAGFDWAQLFYFDFKRLEVQPLANLRGRYERFLFRMAWLLGAGFWLTGSLTALLIYGAEAHALVFLLLPFFLSRSLLASVQIRAFSGGQYAELLTGGLLCLGGLGILRMVPLADAERLLGLSILMLGVYAFLSLLRGWTHRQRGTAEPLSLSEWLTRASTITAPTRVRVLQFEFPIPSAPGGVRNSLPSREREQVEKSLRVKQLRVARTIAKALGRQAMVTVDHGSRVVWLERADESSPLTSEILARIGSGFVREILQTPGEDDGRASVTAAVRGGLLGAELARAAGDGPIGRDRDGSSALRETFEEMFPEGTCFEPARRAPAFLRSASSQQRRSILFEALRFSRDLRASSRRSPFDVTAFCEGGDLRLLFVLPRRASARRRRQWHERVLGANLEAALSQVAKPAAS